MKILTEERQTELVVKKSRFIAIAKICNSMAQVKELVEQTKLLHPNANHVVHAAVIGNEFSFSDAHEPKGTAGRPALEVLKGSGISNICVLIVRYFGGTLLGTGGLVKAYGDSVKLVLDGIKAEEYIPKSSFEISFDYSCYESLKKIAASCNCTIEQETFQTSVTIKGLIPDNKKTEFANSVSDLTKGSCIVSFK